LRVVEIRQVAFGQYAGIVDEDVDGTKLAGYALGHTLHLRSIPDIRLHGEGAPRLLVNERHNVFGLAGAMTIVHRDRSSLTRQAQGNRATYPTGGAGDQRRSSFRFITPSYLVLQTACTARARNNELP